MIISLKRSLSVAVLLMLTTSLGRAQNVDTRPQRGFLPTSDQIASPIDSIDTVTGNLNLTIPLASLPRGRGGSGFDLDLIYNSHIYDLEQPDADGAQELTAIVTTGAWTYNVNNYKVDYETRFDPYGPDGCPHAGYDLHLRIGLPDGSLHTLQLYGQAPESPHTLNSDYYRFDLNGTPFACVSGYPAPDPLTTLTYYTTDGTFLKFEISADGTDWKLKQWTLYFPDGRRVLGKGTQATDLYDANDNHVTFTNYCGGGCGTPYLIIADDFGRTVRIDYGLDDNGETRHDIVHMTGPNDEDVQWTVNWAHYSLGGASTRHYACLPTVTDCNFIQGLWGVSSVSLPPGHDTEYSFGYSGDDIGGWGEVNQMTTPTGAVYHYNYVLEGASDPSSEMLSDFNAVSHKTISHDGHNPDLEWSYTIVDASSQCGSGSSTVTDLVRSTTIQSVFKDRVSDCSDWDRGLVTSIVGPTAGTVKKRNWSQNKVGSTVSDHDPNNPFIIAESTSIADSSGSPALAAVTTYQYDKNGNLESKTEYDWQTYSSTAVETAGSVLKETDMTYWVATGDSSVTSDNADAYWRSTSHNRLNSVRRQQLCKGTCASGTTEAVSEFDYGTSGAWRYTKGNKTLEQKWDTTRSTAVPSLGGLSSTNAVILTWDYDAYGDLTEIYAPQIRTHVLYDALDGVSPGPYPTEIDYAYQTSSQRTWRYSWSDVGTLNSKTDYDNTIVTSYTYDPVGRPLIVTEAGLRRTNTSYDDVNRAITAKEDLATLGDGKIQTITRYDQLGRVVRVQKSDGSALAGSTDGILTDTIYITTSAGRTVVTSSPYRYSGDTTEQWTCTQYDVLNQPISVATFAGGAPTDCNSSTNRLSLTQMQYVGAGGAQKIHTIDADLKAKDTYTDGVGRLTQVVEDPSGLNYTTNYTYDSMDNLLTVHQPDTVYVVPQDRNRIFIFTSLGRLKSANNPESGLTQYTYNDDGTLNSRTDPRPTTVTYTYDPLQRLTVKQYSDGVTPSASYTYNLAGSASAPNIGNLQSLSSTPATTTYTGYDALGRVTGETQSIAGSPSSYTLAYTYFLNDQLNTLQYPSGSVITYTVDDAGRPTKVANGTKTYADLTYPVGHPAPSNITNGYTADGRIWQMELGNSLWVTNDYRPAGTATELMLGTTQGASDELGLEYNYSTSLNNGNNGNLTSHVIRQSGKAWTQAFSYDGVNRLHGMSESTTSSTDCNISVSYGYDPFGNKWLSGYNCVVPDGNEPQYPTLYSGSFTNHIATASYDPAGNMTQLNPYTLTYDAENRLTTTSSSVNGSETISYDGDGRRVKKVWTPGSGISGETKSTFYVYDAKGQLLADYSNESGATGVSYVFTDILGSVRAVTGEKQPSGNAAITECYDYLPFGGLISVLDAGDARFGLCYPESAGGYSSDLPQKFTGKERDKETGLDFFGARYLSSAQGRFLSVDPSQKSVDSKVPQTWNRYSYTYNNPFSYLDSNGAWPTAIHDLIYQGAFQSIAGAGLADRQVSMIAASSRAVDVGWTAQAPWNAFEHGMRAIWQSPLDARDEADRFIDSHERNAAEEVSLGNGVTNAALQEFGIAAHTVTDRTSPSHIGEQVWQPWPDPVTVLVVMFHSGKESKITEDEYIRAVTDVRRAFLKTFGAEQFYKATGCKELESCFIDVSKAQEYLKKAP